MAFGALSISWRVTATTIRARMLMYGKEASNRKQEIDRQHHTIPNKRTKDQKTSTVEMCITCYSVMEKLKCSFPTFCKQTFPQLHKTASYAHSHKSKLRRNPNFSANHLKIKDSSREKFGFRFNDFSVSSHRNQPVSHCCLSIFL